MFILIRVTYDLGITFNWTGQGVNKETYKSRSTGKDLGGSVRGQK